MDRGERTRRLVDSSDYVSFESFFSSLAIGAMVAIFPCVRSNIIPKWPIPHHSVPPQCDKMGIFAIGVRVQPLLNYPSSNR